MGERVQKSFPPKFAIFRREDAVDYSAAGVMETQPLSQSAMEGAVELMAAGVEAGHDTRILFSSPGFSLSYAWFKSGYPLPRHSHNVDCLYYILGGSLRIGTEELKKGDGFFVGEDVPYTYTPGPEGAEVLEFRAADRFDIKVLADNLAFWEKAAEGVRGKIEAWKAETPPSGLSD